MSVEDRSMTVSNRRLRQAALWRIRLQYADFTPELHQRWEAWIDVPEHQQAFSRVEEMWDTFAWEYKKRHQDEIAAPIEKPTRSWRGPFGLGLHSPPDILIVAGSLAALAGAVVLISDAAPATTLFQMQVQPKPGETIEPAPAMETAPLTDIEVGFDGQRRIVHVGRGKAVFRVTKDPRRRFVVTAGPMRIEGAGTEFSVSNSEHSVIVTIVKK